MEDALHEVSRWRSISGLMLLALLLAWERLVPFFSYFAGKVRERLRHGLKNVMLGLQNSLATGAGFAAVWWATTRWSGSGCTGALRPKGSECRQRRSDSAARNE